jgi:regulator of cell morphogenesis and NO signaling
MSTQTAPVQIAIAGQTLCELIEHILVKHHAYLRSELPFLEERIAKMCANHGKDRPELYAIQQNLQDLRDDLTSHLTKEEQILFPYIAQLERARSTGAPNPEACFPSVRFPIRMMLVEHDGAQELLAALRRNSNGYTAPDFVCENGRAFYQRLEGLEADLREHIRIENDVLFPRAVELEEMGH